MTEWWEAIRRVMPTMWNTRGPISPTLLVIVVLALVPVAHTQGRANGEKTPEEDLLPKAEQGRAEAEMQRLASKVSFPTVGIGNRAVAGFSPRWILTSLER